MLIKILQLFTYFIKEILFDKKEEYDFRHPGFNPRKFIILLILLLLLMTSYTTYFKNKEIMEIDKKIKKDNEKVMSIKQKLKECQEDNNNLSKAIVKLTAERINNEK